MRQKIAIPTPSLSTNKNTNKLGGARRWSWCTSTLGTAFASGKPNVRTRRSASLLAEARLYLRVGRGRLVWLSSVRSKTSLKNKESNLRCKILKLLDYFSTSAPAWRRHDI